MSIIFKSKIDVTRSQVNDSVSKQMYSFPKAPRFPSFNKNNGHTDQYYSLPNIRSTRFTTLGFGHRSDFTSSQKGINTKFYGNYSDFSKEHPHGPAFSFASGRDKYSRVFIEGATPNDPLVPGAGKYFLPKPFGYDGIKFSIRGRIEEHKNDKKDKDDNNDKKKQVGFPGPGEYPITIQINEKGKYAVSNIPNVPGFRICEPTKKEQKKENEENEKDGNEKNKKNNFSEIPGPGNYDSKPLIGKIFDSRFRSYNGVTISGRYKDVDSRSNYPGPGSYRLPSDFGQYLSKDADKYPTENVYPVKKYPFEEKAWRHGMKIINKEINYEEKEEIDDNRKIDEIDHNNDDNNNENKDLNQGEGNDKFDLNIENKIEENKQTETKEGNEEKIDKVEENEEIKEGEKKTENKVEDNKNEEGEIEKVTENKNQEEVKNKEEEIEGKEEKKENINDEGGDIEKFMESEEKEGVKPKDEEQEIGGKNEKQENENQGEEIGFVENEEEDKVKPDAA